SASASSSSRTPTPRRRTGRSDSPERPRSAAPAQAQLVASDRRPVAQNPEAPAQRGRRPRAVPAQAQHADRLQVDRGRGRAEARGEPARQRRAGIGGPPRLPHPAAPPLPPPPPPERPP